MRRSEGTRELGRKVEKTRGEKGRGDERASRTVAIVARDGGEYSDKSETNELG